MIRPTRELSVTLPTELVQAVRARVASGEYASASDVVREALGALALRERPQELWLRDQVGPAMDALAADPARARGADHIRAVLAAERAAFEGRPE